jgi:hypothetical protein
VGTWFFKYIVRTNSAAASTGCAFRVNHSGASPTSFYAHVFFDSLGTATAAPGDANFGTPTTNKFPTTLATRTNNTILGPSASTDATTDTFYNVEGYVQVANTGSLTLEYASEAAADITLKANSFLILKQIA